MPRQAVAADDEAASAVVVPVDDPDDPWGLAPAEPAGGALSAVPASGRLPAAWRAAAALVAGLAVTAALGSGLWMARAGADTVAPPSAAPAPTGVLILSSHPAGAAVTADGQVRGKTPLALELAPGIHDVVLTAPGGQRSEALTVTTESGQTASEHVVFAVPPPITGTVEVETSRVGADVLVDGVFAGVTPLRLDGVPAGAHDVTVRVGAGTNTRTVEVLAGATTSLVVDAPSTPAVPIPGWLQLATPFPVDAYEEGRLLGVSRSDRIMVSAGAHTIDLVNEDLGFRTTTTVTVGAGETTTVPLTAPLAPVSITATPWADVEVDGQGYGATPITTLLLPLGDRAVTFRHPTLGARTMTFTVRLAAANRLSADLTH